MKVELHYSDGFVSLEIPQANVEQIIRPWENEPNADNRAVLQRAMAEKETAKFQEEIAGKNVCVLLDDSTREQPFGDVFAAVFATLQNSRHVQFLLCTGTHNADTPENKQIILQLERAAAKARITNFAIHTHDCQRDDFKSAGRTSRGTEVLFNARIDDADIFLVLSDVKVHYFAGYSNPIKNFVPGMCGLRTVEQNHSLALDDRSTFGVHPWHCDNTRRDNPLADDQLEAMRMVVKTRPVYSLVTITTSGRVQWARFGPVEQVSRDAFVTVDRTNTRTVKPVSRLIVSPGGLPNDISLYIAQRALELTKNAVTDGGEILFLAACPKGVGEERTMENFYNRLTAPVDQVLKSIQGEYKLFSHKAYKFALMIKRLRRIRMYSQIPDEQVEAAHLHPTHKPQAVVDDWLGEDPDTKITIVDGANKIALYAES